MAIETTSDLSLVGTSQIVDGSVTSAKIGTGAVGSAALADNAVVAAKISAGSVGTVAISSGSATSGQILQANGSGAVTFETPAAGGGMTLIATATPSAATSLAFTSIPGTYKHLKLIFFSVHQSDTTVYWQMRLNNNSGSVYSYNYFFIKSDQVIKTVKRSGTSFGGGEGGEESVIPRTYNSGSPENVTGRGEINIYRYAELEKRIVTYNSVGDVSNSPIFIQAHGIYTESGTAITSIDFIRSSTQTITGTFYLYGVS
jgi:hypothetical protein